MHHCFEEKWVMQDLLPCHYRKMEAYDGHCFTPQFVHIPGGGHSPLARESEPIRLLKNVAEFVIVHANAKHPSLDRVFYYTF